MHRIIEEALRKLKGQVEEVVHTFEIQGLSPQSLSEFERGLESSLGEVGRSIETAVLEAADIERRSVEIDGQRCYFKYKGPDEYQCLFGKIAVRRSVYQANGEATVCPLERNAGILYHHLTPAAAEFVSYSSAYMVARELAEFCRRWEYLKPSETVIKQVASEVGESAEGLQEIHEAHARAEEGPPPPDTQVVAISRDATSVNVRNQGWKQAEVGAISFYGERLKTEEDAAETIRRERLRTVYVAQMPEERTPAFNAKFEREIDSIIKNLPVCCELACLADGSLGIWKYFEDHPELRFAVHINDFWHAAQYLAKAANALFGKDSEEAERWFKKHRRILKEEDRGVQSVLRSIRYYRKKLGIRSASAATEVRDALRYLTRNQGRMRYAEYRGKGLPIGSGVVEAACKIVVGQRLKRAGMRWSIQGGQSILNLRVLVLSRRWDSFWSCHQKLQNIGRIAA